MSTEAINMEVSALQDQLANLNEAVDQFKLDRQASVDWLLDLQRGLYTIDEVIQGVEDFQ